VTRPEVRAILKALLAMPPEARRLALLGLPLSVIRAIAEEWWWQAHGGQHEPKACLDGFPWRVWAIIAGRGFGKTRAGAEWVWARARAHSDARIALVAASLDEVARVMVDGESGILACARCDEQPRWRSSRGILSFPSGATAYAYTAERPGMLRGPQHHFAWCDELAKWPREGSRGDRRAAEVWDNLMLGLRLGDAPRTIVTTTPRPAPLLKRILAMERCAATSGATRDNPHSPADFRAAVTEMYAGTRLGRQELDGILLEDLPGALWTREMLDAARVSQILPGTGRGTAARSDVVEGPRATASMEAARVSSPSPLGEGFGAGPVGATPHSGVGLVRIVVGVDPPASTNGDACGIIVCGLGADGVAYVLADLTVAGLRPEGWARKVAAAADAWDAQLIVAEKNQGGDMIESVLRGVDSGLPVKLVSATKSKPARAEPVALRFETGAAKLAGRFPELEDELAAITYAGYEGPTNSPDRADAMVWAMTELFKPDRMPRVRGF